jgi:hypothetical protein
MSDELNSTGRSVATTGRSLGSAAPRTVGETDRDAEASVAAVPTATPLTETTEAADQAAAPKSDRTSMQAKKSDAKFSLTIVGNRTGGQGKTLLAQMIARSTEGAHVVAADKADDEGKSKLGRILADTADAKLLNQAFNPVNVVELGVGPSAMDLLKDPHKGIAIWDEVGQMAMEHHVVMDLGAQVVDGLLDWAENSGAAEIFQEAGVPVRMVIPMMASAKAVTDAYEIFQRLVKFQPLFVTEIIFVRNAADGSFSQIDYDSVMQAIKTAVDRRLCPPDMRLVMIDVPACSSNLLRVAEARYKSVDTVCSMDAKTISDLFAMNQWDANRQKKLLLQWREDVLGALGAGVKILGDLAIRDR